MMRHSNSQRARSEHGRGQQKKKSIANKPVLAGCGHGVIVRAFGDFRSLEDKTSAGQAPRNLLSSERIDQVIHSYEFNLGQPALAFPQ